VHERLFRLGTAANLAAFALDVVLITALYVVLKPVHRNLALLATLWGLIETATVSDLEALRILSSADSLRVFEADRLQALARLSVSAHGAAYHVGLVLAGLRSTVFSYPWLKSKLIPKPLAAWGVFSSLVLGACAEVAMGFWLLFKELRPAPSP